MNDIAAIQLKNLTCRLSGRAVLQDVSFTIPNGAYVSLIGANGAGKSTLLRTLLGQTRFDAAQCDILGKPRRAYSAKAFGRRVAYVPQELQYPVEFTVREFTALGRYPHLSPFSTLSSADREAIDRALTATGIESLSSRVLHQLSGGERRLACIAAAVAQDAEVFLLDEPLAHLDYRFKVRVGSVLQELREHEHRTLLVVTHDVDATVFRGDRVLALREGRVVLDGTPEDLLRDRAMEDIYDTDFERLEGSGGLPVVVTRQDAT